MANSAKLLPGQLEAVIRKNDPIQLEDLVKLAEASSITNPEKYQPAYGNMLATMLLIVCRLITSLICRPHYDIPDHASSSGNYQTCTKSSCSHRPSFPQGHTSLDPIKEVLLSCRVCGNSDHASPGPAIQHDWPQPLRLRAAHAHGCSRPRWQRLHPGRPVHAFSPRTQPYDALQNGCVSHCQI